MAGHTNELVLIGGGNMGSALIGGLVAGGWDPQVIVVVEIDASKRADLESRFGVRTSDRIVSGNGAVIAVKPGDAVDVCTQVAALGTPRALSIAAGISASTLQSAAGAGCAVVRAMPNTPALVREGATAISGSDVCTGADLDWAEQVLSAVGLVVRVPESQMDAVTAVAGSGPGYVFLFAEALLAAAIDQGLPVDVADALVRQLFKGAGALLSSSDESPATLRERVTSPNGTTFAGLSVFEHEGLRATVHKAVRAAADRSAEMGT
ncbi:MAG: pyrroline-5-carboxylate reductase [Actinomycetota bacterium]|jgi:pyrroline-5-carboxylate reductase